MQLSNLQVFFMTSFSLLITATPIHHRQTDEATELIDNISTINSSLISLNGTLNTFTTDDPVGLFEALKIQTQTSQTSSDLVAAARTANSSSNFTETESNSIAAAILSLEPTIFTVLNNIVEHKPAFATAILFIGDISKTVESTLNQQRELSREFADAVAAKLYGVYAAYAPLIAAQIDDGTSIQSCKALLLQQK